MDELDKQIVKIARGCKAAIRAESKYGMPEFKVSLLRISMERMRDVPEADGVIHDIESNIIPEVYRSDLGAEVVPAHRLLDVVTPVMEAKGIPVPDPTVRRMPYQVDFSPFVERAISRVVDHSNELWSESFESNPRTTTDWVREALSRHMENRQVVNLIINLNDCETVDETGIGNVCVAQLNQIAVQALSELRYGQRPLPSRLLLLLEQLNPRKGKTLTSAEVRQLTMQLLAHSGEVKADHLISKMKQFQLNAVTSPVMADKLIELIQLAIEDLDQF